ncbi:MAG: T9SS type A sorting domain-containing protein [Flavobacteriales bacterium]|nr:T9SS type A sorting domain-containing protein [Flavobacteriales bacterium]
MAPANIDGFDRTGGPLWPEDCSSCHSGGDYNPAIEISFKDIDGFAVSSYIPGNTYRMEALVSGDIPMGSAVFGFQGMALTDANVQAGDFSNPGDFTQVVLLDGVEYVEQSEPPTDNESFLFEAEWTAPAVGTGDVTIYACGIVGNGDGDKEIDSPAPPITVLLTEDSETSMSDISRDFTSLIYPNPAANYIEISEIETGNSNVRIINTAGKVVREQAFIKNRISVVDLPTGLYFVQVSNSTRNYIGKFLKK